MKKELSDLVTACEEVVRVCNEYNYLFDKKEYWKNESTDDEEISICLLWGFIAQDESYSVNIERVNGKFIFCGKNFSNEGLNAKRAAKALYAHYNISPSELLESFYDSLKKPLGNYSAKEHLEKLKNERTKR